jgi:hypothetical protein
MLDESFMVILPCFDYGMLNTPKAMSDKVIPTLRVSALSTYGTHTIP